MLEILLVYVGTPFTFFLLIYFVLAFYKSGYFNATKISVCHRPPILSSEVVIFYKYCLGSYSNVSNVIKDIVGILPKENASILSIFYDDPQVVSAEKCQSAVGCIFKVDGKPLFAENFALQLTRWGFEKMVLRKVDRSAYCKQLYSSIFSYLHLSMIRSNFNSFLKKNKFNVNCLVEIYTTTAEGKQFVEMFCPLDNAEDFIVPECLSSDQIDSRLARQKFDTEESESESEIEFYEEEEEEELISASQLDIKA